MELDKLKTCQYDETWGPYGKYTNWVTEHEYCSEKPLTKEEFTAIIEKEVGPVNGELHYHKYKQTYSSGKIIYKHILKEVMY